MTNTNAPAAAIEQQAVKPEPPFNITVWVLNPYNDRPENQAAFARQAIEAEVLDRGFDRYRRFERLSHEYRWHPHAGAPGSVSVAGQFHRWDRYGAIGWSTTAETAGASA